MGQLMDFDTDHLYAQRPPLTLHLIETPFDTSANRADSDQAGLLRAA